MNPINFQKVFSKLSHILALSQDNKYDEIVQNIILYSLVQKPNADCKNEHHVSKNIESVYGITIRLNSILSNIDKLIDKKYLIKNQNSKVLNVSNEKSKLILERIEESNKTEEEVKDDWFSEEIFLHPEISELKVEIWNSLKSYLSMVFEQHGVQTTLILKPNAKITEGEQKSLQAIADEALRKNNNIISEDLFFPIVNNFILNANELRANYIAQLADATFTSFAITNDSDTNGFLNYKFNDLALFLDTNFIFGLLNLHRNSEDSSAIEILKEAKQSRLKFKLLYHPLTLSEFRRSFDARSFILKSTKWTKETSRVACLIEELSPLEMLYHRQNIENQIDAKIFLEKYEHVDLILNDLGLSEYISNVVSLSDHVEIEEDIEEYQKFYEKSPHRKPKSFLQFQHDITVLREVRSLNRKKSKFLDCNAFFLSSDYILAKFEKIYYKKSWEVAFVLSPSVFLQIIRPFVENNYETNKRFIETFSIPDFRSFEIDYSGTRSKALQIINDNFHGASFETKVKIVRDQVLLGRLNAATDDYEKQVEIIENQITIENQILATQNKEINEKLSRLNQEHERQLDDLEKQKNHEKLQLLEQRRVVEEELDLSKQVKSRIEYNAEQFSEIYKGEKEKSEKLTKEINLLKKEKRQQFEESELKKWRTNAWIRFGLALVVLFAILLHCLLKNDWNVQSIWEDLKVDWILSLILGVSWGVVTFFISKDLWEKYHNYSIIVNYIKLKIDPKIPEDIKDI